MYDREAISEDELHLMYGIHSLEDDRTLDEYEIQSESTIFAQVRMRGGSSGPEVRMRGGSSRSGSSTDRNRKHVCWGHFEQTVFSPCKDAPVNTGRNNSEARHGPRRPALRLRNPNSFPRGFCGIKHQRHATHQMAAEIAGLRVALERMERDQESDRQRWRQELSRLKEVVQQKSHDQLCRGYLEMRGKMRSTTGVHGHQKRACRRKPQWEERAGEIMQRRGAPIETRIQAKVWKDAPRTTDCERS